MPFVPAKPGEVRNPRGITSTVGRKVAEYIRKLGGDDGRIYADKLHALAFARSTSVADATKIITALMDRGYGPVPKVVDVDVQQATTTTIRLDQLSDDELDRMEAILRKAQGQAIDVKPVEARNVLPAKPETQDLQNQAEKCEVPTGENDPEKVH